MSTTSLERWQAERVRVPWGEDQFVLIEGLDSRGMRWTWRPHEHAWVGLDIGSLAARNPAAQVAGDGPHQRALDPRRREVLVLPLHAHHQVDLHARAVAGEERRGRGGRRGEGLPAGAAEAVARGHRGLALRTGARRAQHPADAPLHVHRLRERAQVQADDRLFQPQPGGCDDVFRVHCTHCNR